VDVSERRSREAAIHTSEERFRRVIEHLPAIVYLESADHPPGSTGAILYVSPQVQTILGFSPADWIGDPAAWARQFHPEDRERVRQEIARIEREGGELLTEYRLYTRAGETRWFRDEATLVRTDAGDPLYWQGVMYDVTGLHDAQARGAEAEERYRALIEQIPAAVYIDPLDEGPTTYMSPQAERMFGYAPEEWYVDPGLWSRIVDPRDRARLDDATEGEPVASTYRVRAKDGHEVWVQDRSRLIHDEDGRPLYWQGVLVDVTEERRLQALEEDLAREHREADRLRREDELRSTFLQAVSHDLRTPLAAILGLAVTLERDDLELDPGEERDMARRIAANARRLDGIVTDFLDLERLRRGLARPRVEPVDLAAVVERVVDSSELPPDRRPDIRAAPVPLSGDPAMLERIVDNLLANAIKHTPVGTRIWIRIEPADAGALLVVEDDGPGVTPGDRERIFEPYLQGEGAAAGSGVGLALVARFAELHGGRTWVEDRPGGGASFRVWLPEEPSAPDDDQPTAAGTSEESQA
jgi:PAS domain S-box-containing protein